MTIAIGMRNFCGIAANIKAVQDRDYRRTKAGVNFDVGTFPWDRLNPYGGSNPICHPFAAPGARILHQEDKELTFMPVCAKAGVSAGADGGKGPVALLTRVYTATG